MRTWASVVAWVLMATLLSGNAFAADRNKEPRHQRYYPSERDSFSGNWKGRWNDEETVDPDIAAQVIALGRGQYRIVLKAKLDMRSPPKFDRVVTVSKGRLAFHEGSLSGEIRGDRFTGRRGSKAKFELHRVELASPTLGAAPPADATVLFDGSGLDAWSGGDWYVMDDGVLMVNPGSGDVKTLDTFKDVELHIEFRTPLMPHASGQQRGNSGVFLQDIYEVQVLDTFGLEGYYDECGALYKVSAPKVNACRPPLQWQTYDITYHGPRYSEEGKLVSSAHITVFHNGVLIQKDQDLTWITAWTEEERDAPPPTEAGSIRLQDHGNYVQYRNIWIRKLPDGE